VFLAEKESPPDICPENQPKNARIWSLARKLTPLLAVAIKKKGFPFFLDLFKGYNK